MVSTRWSHINLPTNLPTSIASQNISKDNLINFVEKDDLMDLVMKTELLPSHPRIKEPPIDIIQAKWSPEGLYYRSRCLFTTLTNRGECNIWVLIANDWVSIGSPSNKYIESLELKNLTHLNPKEQFLQLTEIVNEILITSIGWSPFLNDYAFLACGHSSGKITFWRIESYKPFKEKVCNLNLVSFSLNFNDRIDILNWHQKQDGFNLFVGTSKGQAFLISLNVNDNNLEQVGSIINLWEDKDDIKIGHTIIQNLNEQQIIIIFSKLQHLICIKLNQDNSIVSNEIRVGLISGLEILDNNRVIISTQRGFIYMVDLLDKDKQPQLIENLRLENSSCLGLSAGKLRHFWFLIIRIYNPQLVKSSVEVRLFMNSVLGALDYKKPLWKQMELLENIRINCIQTDNVPGLDKIKDTDTNWIKEQTSDELKIYLQLIMIAIAHEDARENESHYALLVENAKNIKIKLSIIQAVWIRKKFSMIWQNNSSSVSNNNFLCIWSLSNQIIKEAIKMGILTDKEESYPGPDLCNETCFICENPINISITNEGLYKAVGPCNHNIKRCNLTFRQITTEQILICEKCPGFSSCMDIDLIASPEFPKCLYCNANLELDDHFQN